MTLLQHQLLIAQADSAPNWIVKDSHSHTAKHFFWFSINTLLGKERFHTKKIQKEPYLWYKVEYARGWAPHTLVSTINPAALDKELPWTKNVNRCKNDWLHQNHFWNGRKSTVSSSIAEIRADIASRMPTPFTTNSGNRWNVYTDVRSTLTFH